jgi:Flp pilus assembly protein TadG
VQTLELILVTPVIVLVMLAILEFGMLNITQSAITHAATVGAREAGKTETFTTGAGGTVEEIRDEINAVLAAIDIQITDTSSGMLITIQERTGGVTNDYTVGDTSLSPTLPALDDGEVSATLCIAFDATKLNGSPVINAFSSCGFTFNGKEFEISSLARKEV